MSARRSVHRKPRKITLAMAGATIVASAAIASAAAAAPGAPPVSARLTVRSLAASRSGGDTAGGLLGSGPDRELETAAGPVGLQRARMLAYDASQAAARRAAERRAARRAAARKAAARRAAARRRTAARKAAARRAAARKAAAQQAAAQQAAAQQGGSAAAPATPSGSPQQIALSMLGSFGWSSSQFGCLQSLWNRESGWNPYASNPTSGAYGIPQALPGSKMASAGPNWQSDPATQIRWGLGYIQQTYGSPCAAWSHEQATGWY